jgi:hypothetical protein
MINLRQIGSVSIEIQKSFMAIFTQILLFLGLGVSVFNDVFRTTMRTNTYITNFETQGLKLHILSLILGYKNTKRTGYTCSF